MYAYTVCFNGPENNIDREHETDTRLFNSYLDALSHLRFDTEMDHKTFNKKDQTADLIIDEHNGCAKLTIHYHDHDEHIIYNIHKIKEPKTIETKPDAPQPYIVSVAVDARAYIKVMATDPEDARKKAMDDFMEFQCGDLEDIDAHAVNCEDKNGDLIDY